MNNKHFNKLITFIFLIIILLSNFNQLLVQAKDADIDNFNINYNIKDINKNEVSIDFVLNENTSFKQNDENNTNIDYNINDIIDIYKNQPLTGLNYITNKKDEYQFLVKYFDIKNKIDKTKEINIKRVINLTKTTNDTPNTLFDFLDLNKAIPEVTTNDNSEPTLQITFDGNGATSGEMTPQICTEDTFGVELLGTSPLEENVEYYQILIEQNEFKKNGYIFGGWSTIRGDFIPKSIDDNVGYSFKGYKDSNDDLGEEINVKTFRSQTIDFNGIVSSLFEPYEGSMTYDPATASAHLTLYALWIPSDVINSSDFFSPVYGNSGYYFFGNPVYFPTLGMIKETKSIMDQGAEYKDYNDSFRYFSWKNDSHIEGYRPTSFADRIFHDSIDYYPFPTIRPGEAFNAKTFEKYNLTADIIPLDTGDEECFTFGMGFETVETGSLPPQLDSPIKIKFNYYDADGSSHYVSGDQYTNNKSFVIPSFEHLNKPGNRVIKWGIGFDNDDNKAVPNIPNPYIKEFNVGETVYPYDLYKDWCSSNNREINFYAIYEHEYYVYFDGNGAHKGTMAPQIFDTESKELGYNDFRKANYIFEGWNSDKAAADRGEVQYKDGQRITINQSITLYAVWRPKKYIVTFVGNGSTEGRTENQEFIYDQSQKIVPNGFKRTGYTFAGWSKTPDGNVEYHDQESVINLTTGDVRILYAVWEPNTYTVNFNGNNETSGSMQPQTFKYDETKALSTNQFKKTDYTFKGWSTTASGSVTYQDGQEVSNLATEDTITLYAIWQNSNYTITFNGNNETLGSMQSQTFAQNQTQALSANEFKKEGYTFIGWNSDKVAADRGEVQYQDQAEISIEQSMTLYAVWSMSNAPFDVIFDKNGGLGKMAKQAFNGKDLQALNANTFTKTHYRFIGWNTKADGSGIEFANKQIVNKITKENQITLYAQWKANEYEILFDGNGATQGSVAPQSVLYDASAPLNANQFVRKGYIFKEWNTLPTGKGTTYQDQASVINIANENNIITLYAIWTPKTYQVIYNGNGADNDKEMAKQTLTMGKEQTLTNNSFTKAGYYFIGWNTKANGEGTWYANGQNVIDLTFDSDITLYAIWVANNNPQAVTFNVNEIDIPNITNDTIL